MGDAANLILAAKSYGLKGRGFKRAQGPGENHSTSDFVLGIQPFSRF